MARELSKTYDPSKYEDSIYKKWETSGFFNPDNLKIPDSAKPYTIVLPPPNVTGTLHMGHAGMLAYEDILMRFYRMNGYRALWVPGTDHAAIATQTKVEKIIKEEGADRHELGREKFLKRVRQFAQESHDTIINQVKKMGSSCDWSREAYTLDETRHKAVYAVFKLMYDDGLIYRGKRIVNWCPRCHSTLADDEVEYKEEPAKLYWIKYGPFVLATARPETKLGDTAVAVHPDDKRYKDMVGKEYDIPGVLGKFTVRVVADKAVDMDFGSGAIKVTPAHSFADWEIAERHRVGMRQIIDEDGRMMENCGKYAGRTTREARKEIVKDMERMGLIDHIDEDYNHRAAICYRCDTIIEPLPSKQWFINVNKPVERLQSKSIKEICLEAVKSGVFGRDKIKIVPKRFEKNYFHWIENLRDWCVSRQIWYGHRVPVWYKTQIGSEHEAIHFNKDVLLEKLRLKNISEFNAFSDKILLEEGGDISWAGEDIIQLHQKYIIILKDKNLVNDTWINDNKIKRRNIKSDECCGVNPPDEIGWIQDEDTLDTWFSSGLWTFSTLAHSPDEIRIEDGKLVIDSEDFRVFHPTQVLETGYDIIFFWVARMIIMTTYAIGDIPFEDVYLHGLVLDDKGKKMSKSKGNVIDPLDMVNQFGADATRLSLVIGSTPGNDIKLSEEKIAGYRNFVNKLWNVARYIISNYELAITNYDLDKEKLTIADEWILNKLNLLIKDVTDDIKGYRFSQAGERLREFTWSDLADWYLEVSKFEKTDSKESVLSHVLQNILKLWHPFIPFVSEAIWSELDTGKLLIVEKWPESEIGDRGSEIGNEFELVKDVITAIRNARAENKVEPGKKIKAIIYASQYEGLLSSQIEIIKGLRTGIEEVVVMDKGEEHKDEIKITVAGGITVYLIGAIDQEKENNRIKKEIERLEKLISGIKKKLENKEFIKKAPKYIVEKEKKRLDNLKKELDSLKKNKNPVN